MIRDPLRGLAGLRADVLAALAAEVRAIAAADTVDSSGRIPGAVERLAPAGAGVAAAADLRALLDEELSLPHLAAFLDTLASARSETAAAEDRVDLVWTGPEGSGTASRDTAVVVREAFSRAETRVLVAGYVVYRGLEVFSALARRMTERPDLQVRLFLNIERRAGDTSLASEVVKRFAKRFRDSEWPGDRLPELFYDPRSLEIDAGRRAVLHAKCVVVDGQVAFVSSANFTPAAQVRNIEAGALIRSEAFARSLEGHFESLVGDGVLVRV